MTRNKKNKPNQPKRAVVQKSSSLSPKVQPNGKSLSITASRTELFSGPLPHPDLLAKYNDALPNGAERIVAMAEKQQDHRISLENFMAKEMAFRSKAGLYLGFVIVCLATLGAILLLFFGKSIEGFGVMFVPLAAIVGIFIQTRKKKAAELESKSRNLSEVQ